MRIIRYLDVYKQELDEETGEVYNELILQNFTCPIELNPMRISYVEPFYSDKGKLFKNVSVITYDTGEKMKVVGNYKVIVNNKNKSNKIGF